MTPPAPDWERFLPPFRTGSVPVEYIEPYRNVRICITGAGGFIGSALARVLARQAPAVLVLFDSSEGNLFEITRHLTAACPAVRIESVLGSSGDEQLLEDVFASTHPQIVFHAAAFKHVGLLESNPHAAIANNALGTYHLVRSARAYGVSRLVLVSTDKAAKPRSVMGVSKRVAELFTVSLSAASTRMNAVRLGNVIGSPGSVVPLFLECIQGNQPLTVTHSDASRYFLSLDEAVSALLCAGIAGAGGRILLPHFAEPLLIARLAHFLSETLAHDDSSPVPIRYTALRPGEKLREDLLAPGETVVDEVEGGLQIIETQRLSEAECAHAAGCLAEASRGRNAAALIQILSQLSPDYEPSVLALESAALVS